MTPPDPLAHGWWIASRAAGLVAMLAVSVSVLVGLTMATRILRRPGSTRVLASVHEHAALAGLIAIAVHALTLLGDPWLSPGLRGIAVPFTMDYRPVWTGLGIVAAFLAAVLGLSFYVRRRIGGACGAGYTARPSWSTSSASCTRWAPGPTPARCGCAGS